MAKSKDSPEKKGTSPISRQAAYSKASTYFQEAIDTAVRIMRESRNDNAALGAAKTIINKVLPDLKAQELTGTEGKQIQVRIIDYGVDDNPPTKTEGST